MSPAFCALDEAYGQWNFKTPNQTQKMSLPTPRIGTKSQFQETDEESDFSNSRTNGNTVTNNIRTFCPNCKNCVNANDVLQQRVIEQTIYPRPRWEPQYPGAYTPYDPFNRYWANNIPQNYREDFGNASINSVDILVLLQILIFILAALFIVQFVECLSFKYA